MAKRRKQITIDEWVYEELKRRDDVNASGAANEFFKRYLTGDDTDRAAKELRVQRLQEEEEKFQDKAQKKRAEWQQLQNELERDDEQRQEKLRKLRKVPKEPEHPFVEQVADELDMTPAEAIRRAYE